MFSIILPVFHGGDLLRRSLSALRALRYPAQRFEVFVPGPPADANLRQIVEEMAEREGCRIEFVPVDARMRAESINAAFARASGRYIAFADDDVFVEPDWLARMLQAFEEYPEAGLIGGVDTLVDNVGVFDLAFDAVLHSFLGSGRIRSGRGVRVGQYYPRLWNMAIPRSVAAEAALPDEHGRSQVFNAALATHEDVELGERVRRLGKPLIFVPELRVIHRRECTFAAMVARDFSNARICRSRGIHPWPHRLLSGALLSAAAIAIGSFFWRPLLMALLAMIASYVLVLAAVAVSALHEKKHAGVLLLSPVIAASLHLARATGYLAGRRGM